MTALAGVPPVPVRVAMMPPVAAVVEAAIFRPETVICSTLFEAAPVVVTVNVLPLTARLAPSEAGAARTPPLKLRVFWLLASRIVTVRVPGPVNEVAEFSVKVKLAVPVDVDPAAMDPAETTDVLANAAGATTVARSEATSAALVPRLSAFFARFK
jgi:hypothetical protein